MNAKLVLKSVTACMCIAAIFAVAGADLFPARSPLELLVYAGCAMSLGLVLTSIAIVVWQQWNLFGLNHGGTDPQWMWFGAEPPGLQKKWSNGISATGTKAVGPALTAARSGDA